MKKPLIAQVCAGIAWFSLLSAVFALVCGFMDFRTGHPSASGEAITGGAFALSSVIWFAMARVIALLAEIAANTRKDRERP
jgi:hypothetical protein